MQSFFIKICVECYTQIESASLFSLMCYCKRTIRISYGIEPSDNKIASIQDCNFLIFAILQPWDGHSKFSPIYRHYYFKSEIATLQGCNIAITGFCNVVELYEFDNNSRNHNTITFYERIFAVILQKMSELHFLFQYVQKSNKLLCNPTKTNFYIKVT